MGMTISGLVVLGLVTVSAGLQVPMFWTIFGVAYGIYAAGLFLVLLGRRSVGARMIFVASFVFVPIGIIGVLGARKILDELAEQEFQQQGGKNGAG